LQFLCNFLAVLQFLCKLQKTARKLQRNYKDSFAISLQFFVIYKKLQRHLCSFFANYKELQRNCKAIFVSCKNFYMIFTNFYMIFTNFYMIFT